MNITKFDAGELIKGIVLTTLIVAVLGCFDYITGEISIDVLYVFCVLAVAWFTNGYIGALSIAEILFAKVAADYYDKVDIGTKLYCWNSLEGVLINVITCVLAVKLKNALSQKQR